MQSPVRHLDMNAGSSREAEAPADLPLSPTGPKSANPLTDLIDTEHIYVEQLASVIRRVAGAWSRTNFPPKELDQMFRAMEGCFRANRALLVDLEEIGPNPSSPKALGDLLMRWIDDIEPAYLQYTATFKRGFDEWEPVTSNPKQMAILQSLDHGVNSLDGLFILPYQRCRYYKKLYTKLLKSTHPGRSDHRLLSAANDKLDELIMHCETAFQNHVADLEQEVEPSEQPRDSPPEEEEITFSAPPPPKLPPLPNERLPQPPSIPDRSEMPSHADKPMPTPPRSPVKFDTFQSESSRISNSSWAASRDSSNSGSMQASDSQRSSSAQNTQQTSATSLSASVQDMNINSALSTDELEARLNTSRTLDIFSLMPKKCRLQINPPGLSFKRGIRFSGDVAMSFRLSENSVRQRKARYPPEEESQHPLDIQTSRACIFLLTDLFLLCEHNLKTDTLSLLFPPLAGKHLRATTVDADPEGREFEIIIMHKEAVGVRCGSRDERDRWLAHINDCIAFQPPQPLKLNTDSRALARSPSSMSSGTQDAAMANGGLFSPMHPPSSMSPSLGPPAKSPIDGRPDSRSPVLSSYSQRSSDAISASQHDSLLLRSASRSSPVLAGSPRGPSPLGWSGLPNDPRPHHNISPSRPFMPPSAPNHVPTSMPPRSDPWRGPSGNMPPSGPPYPGPAYMPQNGMQGGPPPLPKSHPGSGSNMVSPGLRKDSARSQQSLRDYAHQQHPQPPPMPQYRPDEFDSYRSGRSGRPSPPSSSASMNLSRQPTVYEMQPGNDSPPTSPRQGQPVTNEIIAQNKCKVFLQTNHQQWKSLGTSKLALYLQKPSGDKQLVVNAENKEKSILISTMVLSDGVERVGKTGVAIELSDQGVRTGIRYMLQLKNDSTATSLYNTLLRGSMRQSLSA